MSIRADFQPQVDEFIANLESFATGDYLRDEEKEFWDQPFDPKVLLQLRQVVEDFLDALDALPDDPDAEILTGAARPFARRLEEFNAKAADAVLEPEEWAELTELMESAAAATGAGEEALAALPELG